MKKILSALVITILLMSGVIALSGCNKKEEKNENAEYSKEVETHTVTTTDGTGTVSFEFEKNDKYEITTNNNEITIRNKENYSEIKVRAIHDYMTSTSVTMKEKDFNSEYHDYKEVKVGNYSGWEIYKKDYQYEIDLVLSEKQENTNKVYAADVKVIKSSIMKENMKFDTAEFVKSEDFQHLINSIKLTV